MTKPRVGVVGAGYWGTNLVRNCQEMGILGAICDSRSDLLTAAAKLFPGVRCFARYDELLTADVDAIVIATPAHMHASMALRAIEARKHVFVEKPLALSVEDGLNVCKAAREEGIQLFVGHLMLYHPAIKKLRTLIDAGDIGRVWHVRCKRTGAGRLRGHENVWWSFAPHDVAIIMAIMGQEPVGATSAYSMSGMTGLTDLAYVDFAFSANRSAHIEVCWVDPSKVSRLDVFGMRGTLSFEDARPRGTLVLTPYSPGEDAFRTISVKNASKVEFESVEPIRAELHAFIQSIVRGVPAETNGDEGVAVLRALKMADDGAVRTELLAGLA